MVFSSIIFLFYFAPIFFLVYYVLPNKFKNPWILVASTLFYWWGAPTFIFIFIGSCLLDFYAILFYKKKKQLFFFYLAIISNIGLLVYFKYANFFIENINALFSGNIEWGKIILPIGISFLTFQKISYLIDVRRGDGEYQKKFSTYFLFVVLFPQLIAGPIVRYKDIHLQLTKRFKYFTTTDIYLGLRRFTIGLAKKVLLANVLGEAVDQLFELPSEQLSSGAAIIGLLAYTFQIYFDFSGYSDMAIGMGKMMGFTFPENFNFPYISKSITEFWRRWHITLSSWMRDYLYIPLGGNQKGVLRTYLNLIIVFLISGFWHGASWNFVLWGAYHGMFLVLERLFVAKLITKLPSFISIIYCFVTVSIGWLLFRAESFSQVIDYLAAFGNVEVETTNANSIFTTKFKFIFIVAILFSFMGIYKATIFNDLLERVSKNKWDIVVSHLLILVLFILSVGELFASGFNPFIYFRF